MDKEALFRSRLPEDDVEVPGVGTVRVRALSRAESLRMADASGAEEVERKMLALALLDPALTEDEVSQWQQAAVADELDLVVKKIAELSGVLDKASAKEAYKSVRDEPDAEL